jgi:hypothetical protein
MSLGLPSGISPPPRCGSWPYALAQPHRNLRAAFQKKVCAAAVRRRRTSPASVAARGAQLPSPMALSCTHRSVSSRVASRSCASGRDLRSNRLHEGRGNHPPPWQMGVGGWPDRGRPRARCCCVALRCLSCAKFFTG